MNKLIKQAFTLIELLVVIAIIGILSGLIIVGMNGMTQKAIIAKSQVFSNSLRNSLMMNIVGEWKFDSITGTVGSALADGTVVTDSWSINNGTTVNGPTLKSGTDCISGQCLSFDGSNDYLLATPSSLIAGSSYNISFWVNPHVIGYPPSACGNKNAFLLQWGTSSSTGGFMLSLIYNGTLSLSGQLPYGDSNRWADINGGVLNKIDSWYFV